MHSVATKPKDHSPLLPLGREYRNRPSKNMNEKACVHWRQLEKSRILGIFLRERDKNLIIKSVWFESQIHNLLTAYDL